MLNAIWICFGLLPGTAFIIMNRAISVMMNMPVMKARNLTVLKMVHRARHRYTKYM